MNALLHPDLPTLVATLGYAGVFAIVFCETGVLFGFFLPGDSLLFTAGLLAAQGLMQLWVLVPLLAVAAVAGDSFGYYLGARLGPALFVRDESIIFRKRYVEQTRAFYARHGNRTIVLARFVPIVRTFAPLLAGVATMPYATFVRYNILGGLLWVCLVTLAGYFLGGVPIIARHLELVILAIVALSLVPLGLHWLRGRR